MGVKEHFLALPRALAARYRRSLQSAIDRHELAPPQEGEAAPGAESPANPRELEKWVVRDGLRLRRWDGPLQAFGDPGARRRVLALGMLLTPFCVVFAVASFVAAVAIVAPVEDAAIVAAVAVALGAGVFASARTIQNQLSSYLCISYDERRYALCIGLAAPVAAYVVLWTLAGG